jgi:acyl-CoA synthetase (AMP-forming)/AMP-acid ligase II
VQHGDRIGVMAGNCEQYASLFFAAAAVGAILFVINNTYTKAELLYALEHTSDFAIPHFIEETSYYRF